MKSPSRLLILIAAIVTASGLALAPGIVGGAAQASTHNVAVQGYVNSQAAPTITLLGGLNLGAYCRNLGYYGVSGGHAQGVTLVDNTVAGWRCTTGFQLVGINMTNACQWQYNNGAAESAYLNWSDPYSWYCFLP